MKYVKMLGLAAVAAMGLMAFLGASTASATVLCTTPNETAKCAAGWDYVKGTIWDASIEPGTTAILESTGGLFEDTCTESTVAGEQENTGSSTETVKIEIKDVTVTNTTAPGLSFGNCTKPTKVLNPNGTMEFHWEEKPENDNATVTASGFEVTVEAISGVSCVYSAGAGLDVGTATSGSMGTIHINAIVNKKSGSFLCPADSVWKASYTITDPNSAVYATTK